MELDEFILEAIEAMDAPKTSKGAPRDEKRPRDEEKRDDRRGTGLEKYDGTRISTGSDWIDRALLGGIPLRSMTLVEGPSASGKSVLLQHLAAGALMADLIVAYYTSRGDAHELAQQMASLGLDVADDLASEQLQIFETRRLEGLVENPERLMDNIVDDVALRTVDGIDLVILDDLTWPVSHGDQDASINMLQRLKEASKRGMTIMAAVHSSAYDKELIWRFNKLFDAHISVILETQQKGMSMGVVNKLVVRKIENLVPTKFSEIYFRVNPELGLSMGISLDILPIFKIRV